MTSATTVEKPIGPMVVACNGLNFVDLSSLTNLSELQVINALSTMKNQNRGNYTVNPRLEDLPYLKPYNLKQRREFLLKIYGNTSELVKILKITLPYESKVFQHNNFGEFINLNTKSTKEIKVIPKESVEQFCYDTNEHYNNIANFDDQKARFIKDLTFLKRKRSTGLIMEYNSFDHVNIYF